MSLLTSIDGYDAGFCRRCLFDDGRMLVILWSLSKVNVLDYFVIYISEGKIIRWEVLRDKNVDSWPVLDGKKTWIDRNGWMMDYYYWNHVLIFYQSIVFLECVLLVVEDCWRLEKNFRKRLDDFSMYFAVCCCIFFN